MNPTLWQTAKQWLKEFVLPEKAVTLKLVFDNVRNYLMCAALVVAVQTVLHPSAGDASWPWALQIVVVLLTAMNAVQSWYIIQGSLGGLKALPRVLQSRWRRNLVKLLLISTALMVAIAAFQVIPLLLMVIATGTAR